MTVASDVELLHCKLPEIGRALLFLLCGRAMVILGTKTLPFFVFILQLKLLLTLALNSLLYLSGLQQERLVRIALKPTRNLLLKNAYKIGLTHEFDAPSHCASGSNEWITVSSVSEGEEPPNFILITSTYNGNHDKAKDTTTTSSILMTLTLERWIIRSVRPP